MQNRVFEGGQDKRFMCGADQPGTGVTVAQQGWVRLCADGVCMCVCVRTR